MTHIFADAGVDPACFHDLRVSGREQNHADQSRCEHPGRERLGIVVNDFGALNIDSELIAEKTSPTIALSNGCIRCSIQEISRRR
jgi:hypothetical protein